MPAWINLLVVIFAFIGNILLGLFTYLKNPKSWTNRLFFLFTFSLGSYLLLNTLAITQSSDQATLFWIKTVMAIGLIINYLFFWLAETFPYQKIKVKSVLFWGVNLFTFLLIPCAFTDFIFKGLNPGSTQPIPGVGMPIFLLHTVMLLGGGVIVLIRKYRHGTSLVITQVRLFMLGAIFMFSAILITNVFLVVVLRQSEFVGLLPIYTLIFVGFVSYAIVKHRFLDIRLIVMRSVAYTLLILILGFIYISGLIFISLLNQSEVKLSSVIAQTLPALLIAFSFQSILRSIEVFTNRLFFRGRYKPNDLLNSAGKIMSSTFDLHSLSQRLLIKITDDMKISYGFFILYRSDGSLSIHGVKQTDLIKLDKQKYLDLVGFLGNKPDKIIIFEELEESNIKEILRSTNVTIAALLTVENQNIGLMCLGEKLSGDIYSSDDINVLKILISEVSLAIKNALSIEEIQRFNITLRQEIEKATKDLKSANEQLQELDRLKDEFVSLASHELRTPMTAIRGSLSTILEGYAGDIPDTAREFLNAAYNENDRLIRLVNNLLNISRIEAGRLKIDITVVKINEIIQEVINNLSGAAGEKSLYLKFESDQEIPPVNADPDLVREVLINIIGNAIKFTHIGGVTVRSRVDANKVITSITDSGSGISMDDQPLLFKKFSQVQGSYAKQSGGTGLGLYICKKIIEAMGGQIWLESTLGTGSTFFFSLSVSDSNS